MLALINPVERAEAFDHPDWLFEAKFDGFPAAADTVRGRVISRNSNRMQRLEELLDPAAEATRSTASWILPAHDPGVPARLEEQKAFPDLI